MIYSGWILPNYIQIKCASYSNNKEHILVVKKFLDNLKLLEPGMYNTVISSANDMNITSLDDIAVIILGWIKVNDAPEKIIYYLNNLPFENVLIRYRNLGCTLVPIYNFKHVVIHNPSKYI